MTCRGKPVAAMVDDGVGRGFEVRDRAGVKGGRDGDAGRPRWRLLVVLDIYGPVEERLIEPRRGLA